MIPTTPRTKICKNTISIFFRDLEIKIDTLSNDIYYKTKNTTELTRIDYQLITKCNFNEKLMKQKNLERKKAKVRYFYFPDYVFGIDVSIKDNRLFFLTWLADDYNRFRGGAFWKASYFINKFSKQKEWCEFDLSEPKQIWNFGQAIALNTPQKKMSAYCGR